MAKLIVEIKDATKDLIQKYADDNNMTIKELTLKALAKFIPELKDKD
ncbi:hypothetical protein KW791_00435 [Candidatus Parcubacteria bacterium]|nr:hypothetical protein [Candidatus Parcubacteria bacterium]